MHSKNALNSTPPKFNIELENDGFQKESQESQRGPSYQNPPQKKNKNTHELIDSIPTCFSNVFPHIGLMMRDGSITPNTGWLYEKEPCSNVHTILSKILAQITDHMLASFLTKPPPKLVPKPSWWFQPIWKILVKLGIFPQIGVKIKKIETTGLVDRTVLVPWLIGNVLCIWNHHLVLHIGLHIDPLLTYLFGICAASNFYLPWEGLIGDRILWVGGNPNIHFLKLISEWFMGFLRVFLEIYRIYGIYFRFMGWN